MTANEEWREVPGFNGIYLVSNLGRVWSTASRGKGLKSQRQDVAKGGYLHVTFYDRGVGCTVTKAVHRLVAEAFYSGPRSGNVVRHLNGDPTDNRAENLAWGTSAENNADLVRHGTHRNVSKTHCKHGHEFTPENTRLRRSGKWRVCLSCERRRNRRSVA